ncbi:2S seed storage albumin protein-like [Mercurialis annua]|uniref:2S seed storage albumin protein-like n=1 Tax=Mercurialis annua TaxID=3986 RepID=UPI002160BAAF|nr:2S seed storage albumin protein-like [Mercurialis annua]
MAPKLTILLLLAFFFLVDASNAENPIDQKTCSQQIERQHNLNHCERYIMKQQQQHVRLCCQQLRQMDSNCICLGLSQVIQQLMQGGQIGGEGAAEAIRVAQNLPALCQLSPSRCEIQ